jgi:hypothetical protein
MFLTPFALNAVITVANWLSRRKLLSKLGAKNSEVRGKSSIPPSNLLFI